MTICCKMENLVCVKWIFKCNYHNRVNFDEIFIWKNEFGRIQNANPTKKKKIKGFTNKMKKFANKLYEENLMRLFFFLVW